jgi:hypothetical protein
MERSSFYRDLKSTDNNILDPISPPMISMRGLYIFKVFSWSYITLSFFVLTSSALFSSATSNVELNLRDNAKLISGVGSLLMNADVRRTLIIFSSWFQQSFSPFDLIPLLAYVRLCRAIRSFMRTMNPSF